LGRCSIAAPAISPVYPKAVLVRDRLRTPTTGRRTCFWDVAAVCYAEFADVEAKQRKEFSSGSTLDRFTFESRRQPDDAVPCAFVTVPT
jgi:hypothetical protein